MVQELFQILYDVPTLVESTGSLTDDAVYRALGDLVSVLHERVIAATPRGPVQPRILKSGKRSKAKPYTPGTAKAGWVPEVRDGSIVFSSDVPYIQVLEEGLYPGLGPRTEEFDGGIFSRQAVGGITRKLEQDPEFIQLIMDKIVSELEKTFPRFVVTA